MSEKKKLAIVFGATGNMSFAIANVLFGLKKHSPDLDADIIIFEQGICSKDKELISTILPCNFREYHFPSKNTLNDETLNKFSELTFSRFECFDMLKEYQNVLWLDIDILIQKDIQLLLDEKSTGISMFSGGHSGDDFSITIEGLGHDRENCNAGIMYLQDNLPEYESLSNWCYQKTTEYAPYLKSADQGIINLMIVEKKLEVHNLHWKFNFNPAFGGNTKDAVILHTFCPEKFWNYWDNKEWNDNNKIWVKMGGTPYKGKKFGWWEKQFKNIPNPLKRPKQFAKEVIKHLNKEVSNV